MCKGPYINSSVQMQPWWYIPLGLVPGSLDFHGVDTPPERYAPRPVPGNSKGMERNLKLLQTVAKEG